MITTKETPLWGKIAVTALALLVLVAALGNLLGFVWNYVIYGVFRNLMDLFGGLSFGVVLQNFLEWCGVPILPNDPIMVRLLLGALGLIPIVLGCLGNLLMAVGCVILPVNLWVLSGKRWGNILSVLSMGLVAVGFALVLGQFAGVGMTGILSALLHNYPMNYMSILNDVLPMAFITGMMCILFVTSFFGMRPKWLSVTAAALSIGGLGWLLLSYVAETLNMIFVFADMDMMRHLLPQLIGRVPYAVSMYGLFGAVLVLCLLYTIVARFPALSRTKKA